MLEFTAQILMKFSVAISTLLIHFILINQSSAFNNTSQRLDILAYWVDSQHMAVQVPSHVMPRNSLSFFLRDQSTPNNFNTELPALSYNNDWIILNTSSIPVIQQKELVNKALVLDVMSGSFLMQRTGVALTTVLDDLFYTDLALGQIWNASGVEIRIWSPTAREMLLHLYDSAESFKPVASIPMAVKSGVWNLQLPAKFTGYYYQLEVVNFFPELQNYQTVLVTDPYSPGLSTDGQKTLLVDLDDPKTKPTDWDQYRLPTPVKTIESVIYESHIRDLSANDINIPEKIRGKYIGLAAEKSLAYQHLKNLKNSGITHLHLLPFNDFATVPENELDQEVLPDRDWTSPDEAPTALARIRTKDNYNWGYDPVHWLSPEGSYATDANGITRIYEIRMMIQSIQKIGLHITQDVVFNHTYASDLSDKSVLNKVVPSYYYRLDSKGVVASSSCCADTASENRMMERLMSDSLKHWIKYYHITSFRFDLMSFHSRETMIRLRDVIKTELNKNFNFPTDSVLIFGEAWPFGSLNERRPDLAMSQKNSYGAGIGVFNDRLRDALRGGTTNLSELSDQGFVTGLLDSFNFSPRNRNSPTDKNERQEKFLHLKDVVKIGLAGNLKDFYFKEHWGSHQSGGSMNYRGSPVAYSQSPQETINYVSAHDGTTLWDAIQAKMSYRSEWAVPSTTLLWERVRRQQLALSFILFSQGIPFIEGGTEILRSKNGDVDSYDSGDYYNALNLNLQSNNWNRALPPEWKNGEEWNFWSSRIADGSINPQPQDITQTLKLFKVMLEIRKHYDAFSMDSLASIQERLLFLDENFNTDPELLPMSLNLKDSRKILVIWNTSRSEKIWHHPVLNSSKWQIVPELNSQNTSWFADISLTKTILKLPPISFVVLLQQDYQP